MAGPSQVGHERAGIQRYIIDEFTGGLHSEDNFTKVGLLDTETPSAQNVEFWPVGTISKRNGRQCMNTTTKLSGAVIQLYQWWTPAGGNYLMAFTAGSATSGGASICSGGVYYLTPTSSTLATVTPIIPEKGSGYHWIPGATDSIFVEAYAGSAIFVDGIDYMMAWDGTTCSALGTAPKGAKYIKGYKNYLFAANSEPPSSWAGAGIRGESRIYWSDPGDAQSWPDANWLDLDSNDGDTITGMDVISNELIIFKERRVYAISYVGGSYTFYSETRVDGRGCGAGASLSSRYGDITFYGIDGYYAFDGRELHDLSTKIKNYFQVLIIPSVRELIFAAPYEEKDQNWVLVPMSLDTNNKTHAIVYDYDRQNWTLFTNSAACVGWYVGATDQTFGSLGDATTDQYILHDETWGNRTFLSNSTTLITGQYDGFIMANDVGTSDNGEDIIAFWRSKWIDFGNPDINKRIVRVTFYLDREVESSINAYNVTVNFFKDWDSSTAINTQYVSTYGSSILLEKRIDLSLSCRALQLEVRTDLKSQHFCIHKIVIEYIPKGRTLVS